MRRPLLAYLLTLPTLAGCATQRATLAPGQSFPVFFNNAAVVPDTQGQQVISAAVAWAHRYPGEAIQVTGYADPRAPANEAQRLAASRADAVAALLEEHGLSPDRIHRAIGDEALIGYTGLGNRRVDIAVGL